jgi:hypothetical protein
MLTEFASREGMAVIAFDLAGVPKQALGSVLTPSDAKGIDFQTVCLLNGGALLRRIAHARSEGASDSQQRRKPWQRKAPRRRSRNGGRAEAGRSSFERARKRGRFGGWLALKRGR